MTTTIASLEQSVGVPSSGEFIRDFAVKRGWDPDYLSAILQAESGQKQFDGKGRLLILPERHIFHRQLPKPKRAKAVQRGLAVPKWSRKTQYRDLGGSGSDKRWQFLQRWEAFHDTETALLSMSGGAHQCMGFNHKLSGFASAREMFAAFAESGAKQEEGFVNLLIAFGLDDEIREMDSRAIARRYNGPGQVDKYSRLIRSHYARLSGKSARVQGARRNYLRLGDEGAKVKGLQMQLVDLGYALPVDGDFGVQTRKAVMAFQADHGLTVDGLVGPKTEEMLRNAVPVVEEAREQATLKDLREKGSQTVKDADGAETVAVVAGGGTVVTTALEVMEEATETAEQAADKAEETIGVAEKIIGLATDHWQAVMVILLVAAVFYFARRIKASRLRDHRTGKHMGR